MHIYSDSLLYWKLCDIVMDTKWTNTTIFTDILKKTSRVCAKKGVHFTASTHAHCPVFVQLLLTFVSLRCLLSHWDHVRCRPVAPDFRLACTTLFSVHVAHHVACKEVGQCARHPFLQASRAASLKTDDSSSQLGILGPKSADHFHEHLSW